MPKFVIGVQVGVVHAKCPATDLVVVTVMDVKKD
jgi:hypothetical protein